jgi:hypothetical protein
MIDVEGHEIEVLIGMTNTISRYLPVLLVEVHALGNEFRDYVSEKIEPLGYTSQTAEGKAIPSQKVRFHCLLLPPETA